MFPSGIVFCYCVHANLRFAVALQGKKVVIFGLPVSYSFAFHLRSRFRHL